MACRFAAASIWTLTTLCVWTRSADIARATAQKHTRFTENPPTGGSPQRVRFQEQLFGICRQPAVPRVAIAVPANSTLGGRYSKRPRIGSLSGLMRNTVSALPAQLRPLTKIVAEWRRALRGGSFLAGLHDQSARVSRQPGSSPLILPITIGVTSPDNH